MKMIKAMKKLKFWSSKKRKRKYSSSYDNYFDLYNHHKPRIAYHHSTYHYSSTSSSSSSSAQPSAPPLPPWLEQELTHEFPEPSWAQSVLEENETSPMLHNWAKPISAENRTSPMLHDPTPKLQVETPPSSSYQPCMDSDLVLGLPVVQTSGASIQRRSNDVLGWFLRSGMSFVVCVFPCFTIREDNHDRLKLLYGEKKV